MSNASVTNLGIKCLALVDRGGADEGTQVWVSLRIPWDSISYIHEYVGSEGDTAIVDLNGNTILTNAPFPVVEAAFVEHLVRDKYMSN